MVLWEPTLNLIQMNRGVNGILRVHTFDSCRGMLQRNQQVSQHARDLKRQIDCSFQLFTINFMVNRLILQVSCTTLL